MKRVLAASALLLMAVILSAPLSAPAETVRFENLAVESDVSYVDMKNVYIHDWNQFYAFLRSLPDLEKVDMFYTPVNYYKIRDLETRFPDITFGWTIVIGDHKVRTDQTAFSTLHNVQTAELHDSSAFSLLKYCKNLKALDFGHNAVHSLDFLYDLPDLRVLIIACNYVEDLTPVASLKNLEYLEIFWNNISDLTPLTGLTHLMDLNIVNNYVADLTPLHGMTWLKRLWVFNCYKNVTKGFDEKVEALRKALPDTYINSVSTSTGGGWRKHPHYDVIQKMFSSGVYIPFEDSFPEETEDAEEEVPASSF